jgi:hypothetical protein
MVPAVVDIGIMGSKLGELGGDNMLIMFFEAGLGEASWSDLHQALILILILQSRKDDEIV